MDSKTEILSQIKQAVLAIDASAELILFGSRARGDFKKDSDWDVLVLSDKKINIKVKKMLRKPFYQAEITNNIELNSIIVNRNNWYNKFKGYPLFFEVKKDGIRL